MNTRDTKTACDRARERMHLVLDGDPLEPIVRSALDDHVETCTACAEAWDELQQIQSTLRGLPARPLPDDALAEVLDRTSRAGTRRGARSFDWRWIAAAAAVTAALWVVRPTPDPEVDPAEVRQAEAEARLVLMLTAQALRSTQQAALREVAGEVSPALRRVPIKLPPAPGEKEL